MATLSILIPARNEQFLARTVQDILEHKRGDTEILVGLDGQWAEPGIPDHPDVKILYVAQCGQRALTNQLARLSQAKYVMKVDAHCAFDEGFDVKMMADMQDHWTMVPTMRNLHAFNWVCPKGHTRYQGPSGPCQECGEPTTQDVCWIPKTSPQSKSYCFDSEPHFQYFGDFNKRPEGQGELTESMSLQGSLFMCTLEKYWELGLSSEEFGSWGSQGIEVACKTWLSGGRVVVNQRTWYGHLFRTQGGDFSFPYPQSGNQVQKAKKHARNLFFGNRWGGQVYPLSWLVKKFWPVKGWSDADLAKLIASESTTWHTPSATRSRQEMSSQAVGASSFGVAPKKILRGADKLEVVGVAAAPILTDGMVDDRDFGTPAGGDGADEPRVHQPVGLELPILDSDLAVSILSSTAYPIPASSSVVKSNLGEESGDNIRSEEVGNKHIHNSSIYQKGIIFYTDNQLKLSIAHKVQNQLKKTGLPITSASLKPMPKMGKNVHLPLKRGVETYFRQIIAALEASEADIVFFCEHDVLYHPSHFDFIPGRQDKFYYNTNVWRVRTSDGLAVTWEANQVAELCCYRKLALDWYRNKLDNMLKNGFDRSYEPGGRNLHEYEQWRSEFSNIDIRHGANLTKSKWSINDFRDKSTCVNWQETTIDSIPGWDNLAII